MTDLIRGLVQVRDALTLIAFLSLVLLAAFKTQKVPELFFGLVRDKLTRGQFSNLLHRFMTLGFIAFLVLVALAVLAQVLSHVTQPSALSIEDLRRELAKAADSEDAKIHAEAQYKVATEMLDRKNLAGAIAALEESIKAVPTLTAQELVTYLYGQKGDLAGESAAWERAIRTARKDGDWLALVRLERVSEPRSAPSVEGAHDLIGPSTPLEKGGDTYETASRISPGRYRTTAACFWWFYTLYLKPGQVLDVDFRSPSSGGLAELTVFGTNGEPLTSAGDGFNAMRGNAGPGGSLYRARWAATVSGWYFIRVGADPGTVYNLQVA